MASVRRYDAAPISKLELTPQGGLKVAGRLTRTGIFEYRQSDGSVRKEYRPAEEVFRTDALKTFQGAPVTVGHAANINPDNWGTHAVGHIGDDVRQDGEFVEATLHIQRADAVKAIKDGKLKELSCGYDVDLEEKPGEADGQRYDAVQRNIRGNHVAMGPAGWGRAGKEACMRLDSAGNHLPYTVTEMPEAIPEPRVDHEPELDRLTAENAVLKSKVTELQTALTTANDPQRFDAAVNARMALVESAKKFGVDPKGKTSRQIKEACVLARNGSMKFDSVSDDFVEAAYQMALSLEAPSHPSLGQIRVDAANAPPAGNSLLEAEARNRQASLNAWKQPLSTMNPIFKAS